LIAYMTDDDLMFPDHLARGRAALDGGPAGLAAFRCAQVRFPDDLDPFFFAFDWNVPVAGRFLRHWFIGSANLVHRRDLFDRIGYWDASLVRFGDREFYRRARLAGEARYVAETTLLRFFAGEWDARYAGLPEPPQKRYAERIRDPSWVRDLRAAVPGGRRSARVRLAQARDFLRFAARSGPRFVRFALRRPAPAMDTPPGRDYSSGE